MAGGSERHNRITGNIILHLRAATRRSDCRAFMADMKLETAGGRPQRLLLPGYHAGLRPRRRAPPVQELLMLHRRSHVARNGQHRPARENAPLPRLTSLRYYLLVDADRVYARLPSRDDDGGWLDRSWMPKMSSICIADAAPSPFRWTTSTKTPVCLAYEHGRCWTSAHSARVQG